MSRKVCVQTEIRDMLILKNTLEQLGHKFTEKNQDIIEIQRSYHPIKFETRTGEISYDEMNTKEVHAIKQAYAVNFYKDQAIKEGNQVQEVKLDNGDIRINIL